MMAGMLPNHNGVVYAERRRDRRTLGGSHPSNAQRLDPAGRSACREVDMATILRVTDDSTRAEIGEAIGHLRTRQQVVALDATKAEIQAEIDALLERWQDAC